MRIILLLFLDNQNTNFLLTSYLNLLIQNIINIIEKWFFIRYKEADGSHIHFRYKIKDLKNLSCLLKISHNWAEDLMQKKWIREVQFATYDREIEEKV